MLNNPKKPRFADFSAEEYYAKKELISLGIAARLTRGNINIQLGNVLTAERLNQMRDELAKKIKEKELASV